MREFMAEPVQSLRRAMLPLDCSEHWSNGGVGAGGVGSSIVAAASAAAAATASGGGGGSHRGVNAIHESLVKVLLRVDCIQPEVRRG